MFDRDRWQEIISTITKHKLRTFLTALGVFWGVFMLVFMLAMGKGLENSVFKDFGSRARNVLFVWSSVTSKPYKGFQPGRRVRLTMDDVDAIKDQVKEVELVAPRISIQGKMVNGLINKQYDLRGELPAMRQVDALIIYKGRFIQKSDVDNARKITSLGKKAAETLFPDQTFDEIVGQSLLINGTEFKIVGIYGPQSERGNRSTSESASIPLTTMSRTFATGGRIHYMAVTADKNVKVSVIEKKVKSLLKERHQVHPDDPRGIGGFNLEKIFNQFTGLFTGISVFLWIVGIGTLLAGIVGVSNIMLITVKERTQEIGIRKALGASPGDIILSVLLESVFLTAVAGFLGFAAATFLIWGIDSFMTWQNIKTDMFYQPEVDLAVGIGALIILVIAGALAGLLPARQAASVNPVIALKNE